MLHLQNIWNKILLRKCAGSALKCSETQVQGFGDGVLLAKGRGGGAKEEKKTILIVR